jgi:hypothetical protein
MLPSIRRKYMKIRALLALLLVSSLAVPLFADPLPAPPSAPIVGSCVVEEDAPDLLRTLNATDGKKSDDAAPADKLRNVDPAQQKLQRGCDPICVYDCNSWYGQGTAAANECICTYCCTRC